MANSKPRILNNNRDMVWSLIPLVIACLLIAGIASQCTLSPGGPKQGPIPNFDVDAALQYDASELSFPIRNPKVPEDWTPNSGSRQSISGDQGGDVSNVGFISGAGRYIRLTQSNATEDVLVPFAVGEPRYASGTQSIDGKEWIVYEQSDKEPVWVTDLGDVRLLVTGSGSNEEFTELATATTSATPLTP
ncbi:DUF4245 domain-containing protein [Rhodococcus sp. BP-252]|uniref:DUF4245 domain-containing protein n=1 Tax=Rhodococcoides kyotonense TaxID=398843 RepID=A0A177YAJ0_9NOCA|nr:MULTISPECIES: DUF4245 domain-containing protein [Rhodococcus]NIL74280.1 hypothetical protein [Rhodococcus sp. B10]MBY6411727.1 DUF4245 domain-containing protein [Rhodococcus sp. BP-320]MBY6417288.1 DUF4245 domain-containing protein [Rhodococcus sp. BP-321]MBY6421927.1 DUF4245 domain-containing protein [Rhodococcus sp. BP-324]MBY6427312.1 DUF4245 domain-containing protein [Rhodococcus sp. BP-323]